MTDLTNLRWLTGFTGSAAMLAVSDRLVLITDGRYATQAASELAAAGVAAEIEITADPRPAAVSAVDGAERIGLEADAITWAQAKKVGEGWLADHRVVPTDGVIRTLRRTKDAGEVARISAAAAITDAALADVLPMLEPGVSERDFAQALDAEIRRLGAAASSFETIVASGPNSALPHARPGHREVEAGDLVIIDVGALVDGYHSDMTRTFTMGEPSADQDRMLAAVQAAQQAGLDAVRAGVAVGDVDDACRSVLVDAGLGDAFSHGTGHGVGLDIHELPSVSRRSDAVLADGDVITIEPGVYLEGTGGVRWEDLVHVDGDGSSVLTNSPKEPVR